MRTFELMFISSPNTIEEDINKLISILEHTVTDRGGTVTKIEPWGRRKLAYRIDKFDEAVDTILGLEEDKTKAREILNEPIFAGDQLPIVLEDGYLAKKGLVALPKDVTAKIRESATAMALLKGDELK